MVLCVWCDQSHGLVLPILRLARRLTPGPPKRRPAVDVFDVMPPSSGLPASVHTHALLSWMANEPLEEEVVDAYRGPSNLVVVSAASLWEIAIERQIGRLQGSVADGPRAAAPTTGRSVGELAGRRRGLSRSW